MPRLAKFIKGSVVFFSGDKNPFIYILQSGSVSLTSMDLESGMQVAEQVHVGEFLGVKAALSGMPSLSTATAMTDSALVQMNIAEFEKAFGSRRDITEKMLRVFSKSLRDIHKKLEHRLNPSTVLNDKLEMYHHTSSGSINEGIYRVAKSFFDDEQYRTCISIINHATERYASLQNNVELARLLEEAKRKGSMVDEVAVSEVSAASSGGTPPQFSSPMFNRFTKNYKQGEVIICENEPGETFYLIKHGEVQVSKLIKGENKSLDILGMGAFFGEMAILDNSPRSATCVARTDVSCLEFDKDNFKTVVFSSPQIVMELLKIFSKRIYDQTRQFRIVFINDIHIRVCDVLVMYDELSGATSRRFGDETNPKRVFSVTANEIASWAAISPEEAKAELEKLQDRGKVELFDNYMNVVNIFDIKRMVDTYFAIKSKEENQ